MFKYRICSWCNSTFTPKSPTTKYCCEECKRSEFLFNQIPEDFHSSTLSDLEFIKTYLVSDKGTKKAFTSRLDHAVIHKSPQFERIKRIQAFAESSIVGDDVSNVDKIRLLANGVTFRPVCETEGCNRLTKYVGLGFNRICHSFCSTNTLHIPYPSEHCHWCGSPTENGSPFCSTNIARCSQIYFEHILPFENGIKTATEEGLVDYELVKKFGFNDNGVFRKWLADENAVKILGATAFKEAVEKASELYGETSSNAIRALVYESGERPVCAAEGCEERVRFPHGLAGWNKYCSKKCSGKGEILKNTGTRELPEETVAFLNVKENLEKLLEENENNVEIAAASVDVSASYFGRKMDEFGIPSGKWSRSNLELKIKSVLEGVEHIENYRPEWLIPTGYKRRCELDFYIPSLKLAIELHGEYWHSEKFKGNTYHHEKQKLCEGNGVKLIQLFQHELENRYDFWVSYFSSIGNVFPLNARELELREVGKAEEKDFFERAHPQGYNGSSKCFGLYDGELLVMAASFGKPRFGNYEYELIRMSTLLGFRVRGGASKLLRHAINELGITELVSYCDLSYGSGGVYEALGFKETNLSLNYFWFNSRSFQIKQYNMVRGKQTMELLGDAYDKNISIEENLRANKWLKVYRAGSKLTY